VTTDTPSYLAAQAQTVRQKARSGVLHSHTGGLASGCVQGNVAFYPNPKRMTFCGFATSTPSLAR